MSSTLSSISTSKNQGAHYLSGFLRSNFDHDTCNLHLSIPPARGPAIAVDACFGLMRSLMIRREQTATKRDKEQRSKPNISTPAWTPDGETFAND